METLLSSYRHYILALLLVLAVALPGSNGRSQGLTQNWNVFQESSGGLGFDSNIYGSRSTRTSDGFTQFSHSLRLARTRSLTNLEMEGDLKGARYFSEGEADFLDGGLRIQTGYPNDADDSVSFWKGSAHWRRDTELNLDTGLRLQPTLYGVSMAGGWLVSPKLGLNGSVQSTVNDRSRDGFNTTRKLRFRTGLSHAWRPEQRWNAEYAYTAGHADGGSGTDSRIHEVGVRVRGKLLSKVSGDAFVGVQKADFSGRQDFSDSAPIFSADLKWQSSPRFVTTIGVDRDYDFSANGLAKLRTLVTLSMKRELGRGYSLSGYVSRGFTNFKDAFEDREDRFWAMGGEFEYAFTERFYAQLSATHVTSRTEVVGRDFERAVFLLRGGFRY